MPKSTAGHAVSTMTSESLYDLGVTEIGPAEAVPADPPCPVCGETLVRPVFRIERVPWRVVICPRCGTGRLDPLPSPGEIAAFYPPAYYGSTGRKFKRYVEWAVRFVAARRVRFMARRVPPGGRVLDIGCGRGTLLMRLATRGFEVHGLEVSPAAVEGADPRAQIRIASDLAEAAYPGDYFDLIILWHVFEHLGDPSGTLREVHRILRPGGDVVIAVPNFASWQARWSGPAWFHLDPPRHLYHFPAAALQSLLTRSGFQCRSEHHFSLRQNPFGWVQSALNKQGRWRRNALYDLLQRRPESGHEDFSASTKAALLAAFALGMPVGLALELLATLFRTGATVHMVAEKVARTD